MNVNACNECGNRLGLKRNKEGVILCRACMEDYSGRKCPDLQTQLEEANHIIDHIFLGTEQCATEQAYLHKNSIRRVLVVGDQIGMPFERDPYFTYLRIPLHDESTANIRQHFEECFAFIEKRVTEFGDDAGNVLVHCVAGMSRSPTIVIAYIMNKYGLPFVEAFNFVKQRRPIVQPNPGFVQQLKKFEAELAKQGKLQSFPGGLPKTPWTPRPN